MPMLVGSDRGMAAFGQQVDQARHVAESRCIEEGCKQSMSLSWIDRIVPLFGQMITRSERQLPRVGIAELENLRDLAERNVERLAKHVNGSFDR